MTTNTCFVYLFAYLGEYSLATEAGGWLRFFDPAMYASVKTKNDPARRFGGSSCRLSRMDNIANIDPLHRSVTSDVSKENVAKFQTASWWRARWQVINSFLPYALLWFAMDRAL